jgi:hypothetical protein
MTTHAHPDAEHLHVGPELQPFHRSGNFTDSLRRLAAPDSRGHLYILHRAGAPRPFKFPNTPRPWGATRPEQSAPFQNGGAAAPGGDSRRTAGVAGARGG